MPHSRTEFEPTQLNSTVGQCGRGLRWVDGIMAGWTCICLVLIYTYDRASMILWYTMKLYEQMYDHSLGWVGLIKLKCLLLDIFSSIHRELEYMYFHEDLIFQQHLQGSSQKDTLHLSRIRRLTWNRSRPIFPRPPYVYFTPPRLSFPNLLNDARESYGLLEGMLGDEICRGLTAVRALRKLGVEAMRHPALTPICLWYESLAHDSKHCWTPNASV